MVVTLMSIGETVFLCHTNLPPKQSLRNRNGAARKALEENVNEN